MYYLSLQPSTPEESEGWEKAAELAIDGQPDSLTKELYSLASVASAK